MTSRPAAPESETPEVDALFEEFINAGGEKDVIDYHAIMRKLDLLARSLERRLSLAQARIAELEKLFIGWDGYCWKDGKYIDDVQEFFDAALKSRA